MKRFVGLFVCVLLLAGCAKDGADEQQKLLAGAEFDASDYVAIQEANEGLAYHMASDLYADGKNIFVSPISLFFALGMAYEAADGETKLQMADVMGVSGLSDDEVRAGNAALLNVLLQRRDSVELHVANSIWLNERYAFDENFVRYNEHYYTAEVAEIDFAAEKSVVRVNEWIEQMTGGKITDMIDEFSEYAVAVLLNTIYFQGDWLHEFNEEVTNDRSFYLADGSEVTVPMMQQTEDFHYVEDAFGQIVRLPYKNDEMAMYVVLPHEELGVRGWLDEQDAGTWLDDIGDMVEEEEVHLSLPSFKLEEIYELNGFLESRGMVDAFTEGVASFPFLVKGAGAGDVVISEVIQKSYIEVEESGTEAAAATEVGFELMSAPAEEEPPIDMRVDRPFLFVIVDEDSAVPLFVGVVENPFGGE